MSGTKVIPIVALGLAALMIAPSATAQDSTHPLASTPTTLYFHIFDVFNNFPINTQIPQPNDFFQVGGTNFPTAVISETPEGQGKVNYDFNTIYGYSTAGPVEYNFTENGQPRFHPERGIAADVLVDPNANIVAGGAPSGKPAVAHIYVSVRDFTGKSPGTTTAPNLLPSFTFNVEMRSGNQLGDPTALDATTLFMSGSRTAHLMYSKTPADQQLNGTNAPDGNVILVPNADGIVEYIIPMTYESGFTRITKADGYHMKITWSQPPSGQPSSGDQFAEGFMRIVSSNTYHDRLDMAIMNPIYIDFVHPQVAAGLLLIHTAENSPWGTYDLDLRNMTVEVTGPSTPQSLTKITTQNSHVHNLHNKSAEVTYLWRYRDEAAAVGDYRIHVAVPNLAHTAVATADGGFHVDAKQAYGVDQNNQRVENAPVSGNSSQKSPDASPFLAIGFLAMAALMWRRRG
jgi:hypothetical protein